MPAPPKKPARPTSPPLQPAQSNEGGSAGSGNSLQGDSKSPTAPKKSAPKKECKLTPKQIGQLSTVISLAVAAIICGFFALDLTKIGQITKKIMRSKADHKITYSYFRTTETWKSLVTTKFYGSMFPYGASMVNPRLLLAVKSTVDGVAQKENDATLKVGFWFCSEGDFTRIYRRFVNAFEMDDKNIEWKLPHQNPAEELSCTVQKFKQLKKAPENICWLQMHETGRDDEVDKKNLAVYLPLVMAIGFFLIAVVLTVWALQKPEGEQQRGGVRKLNKNLAAATGATVQDNQDEKRNDPRADMVV